MDNCRRLKRCDQDTRDNFVKNKVQQKVQQNIVLKEMPYNFHNASVPGLAFTKAESSNQ